MEGVRIALTMRNMRVELSAQLWQQKASRQRQNSGDCCPQVGLAKHAMG